MSARGLPLCALLLAWGAIAPAAPLDLGRVPATARWVMHLDVDAARESTVMKRAWERAVKMHPQAEQMMKVAIGMTGIDPRKDLFDVTAYGHDADKHKGVMIVHARVNREMLEKMVAKAPDHETMEHRAHVLHAWTHKGRKGRQAERVVGVFHRDDILVFARTPDRVKAALDVLDGEAAFVQGDGPLDGRVRPGSILVARAAAVDPDTKCPVLRQARSFRVAMGENDGQSFYRARLGMKSDEDAGRVEDVVEGLESLARLRWGDEARVMKLVDGLGTRTDGATCMISWNAQAEDVGVVMESMADRWEQKRKEWMRAHAGRDGGKWPWGWKGGCGCGEDGCGQAAPGGQCPMRKGDDGAQEGGLRDDEF